MRNLYKQYAKETEYYSDMIQLSEAVKTNRKGSAGIRDRIVFGKQAWQEALTWFSIIQSIVIFMALIPTAIMNLNNFFNYVGLPIQFPISISSVGAVIFIFFMFTFGLLSYRHFGLPRRSQEIGSKINPSFFMLWDKLNKLEEEVKKLKK